MPIYEFVCPNCGEKVEVITKEADVLCRCGKRMKRLFPKPAFIDAEQFRSKK